MTFTHYMHYIVCIHCINYIHTSKLFHQYCQLQTYCGGFKVARMPTCSNGFLQLRCGRGPHAKALLVPTTNWLAFWSTVMQLQQFLGAQGLPRTVQCVYSVVHTMWSFNRCHGDLVPPWLCAVSRGNKGRTRAATRTLVSSAAPGLVLAKARRSKGGIWGRV